MTKEQLPNSQPQQKQFNPLALYLEADTLMTNLKSVLIDYREGSIAAINKCKELQAELDKHEEKKK
ncbi:MAG: hypothetical protein GY861_12505 [bacterium]|nr:hypothetical protein [bacterium]